MLLLSLVEADGSGGKGLHVLPAHLSQAGRAHPAPPIRARPMGTKRTYLGRRTDMNAKETALFFLCGMAGALALVVAQRLLG